MGMNALGMIETVGLAAAIEAADTAVKSANVSLLGYELTKGGGMITVKFEGDVGAVKAAVEAAVMAAERVGKVYSKHIIPRLGSGVENVIYSKETIGPGNPFRNKEMNTEEETISLEEVESTNLSEPLNIVTSEEEMEAEKDSENEIETLTFKTDSLKMVAISPLKEEADEVKKTASNVQLFSNETENDSTIKKEAKTVVIEERAIEEQKEETEVCNICKDPKCPRRKGDLRSTCIHEN
ncbi:BMC domain-containing protein [Robertmurraya massiliosenegalensis]|uniref:BMC domain-containing protein n=1 Tax=Robertmurraya massiliosenegalensis TaxID=1287657 RepID=UPI00047497CB|nr:BMC domain-containing protein [Robertmurraya massiliosenegalensis]